MVRDIGGRQTDGLQLDMTFLNRSCSFFGKRPALRSSAAVDALAAADMTTTAVCLSLRKVLNCSKSLYYYFSGTKLIRCFSDAVKV